MPWSRKFLTPIILDNGRTFVTLRHAADYVLTLSDQQKADLGWQYAIELMRSAAKPKSGDADLWDAEDQLGRVLRADGLLGLKGAYGRPRSRRR